MKTILLGTCEPVLRVLAEELQSCQAAQAEVDGLPLGQKIIRLLLYDDQEDVRQSFPRFAQMFSGLDDQSATVIVARANPLLLNPLRNYGHESLLAMLILAFPEVRWRFCALDGYETDLTIDGETADVTAQRRQRIEQTNAKINDFRKAHGLHILFCPEQASLLDATGLRDWVRQRIIEDSETSEDGGYLSRRTQSAIALDEETPYAFFHAYTAYRYGFRAIPITTRAQAEHWLGTNSPKRQSATIVFEDFFLNFPDGGSGYSKLWEARHTEFQQLEDIPNRIFITSDQKRRCDKDKRKQNCLYLKDQRARGKYIPPPLHKPTAGIFKLWEDSGLKRKLSWRDENGERHRGTAKQFLWPPPFRECDKDTNGHSAPGILLVIADKLIERAEKLIKDGASCVEEAVTGAVLATDALELLGGKTPTTSIEALRLKHEFEILAECQFAGVEYHVSMSPRLDDIQHEVRSICKWFHPDIQHRAALNAEMSILTALVGHLRKYGRFDEEQTCMNRIRHLHNSLWMQHPRQAYRFIMWPVLRYLELLLSSFFTFFVVLFLWIVALTALYYWIGNMDNWVMGLKTALKAFLPAGDPIDVAPVVTFIAHVSSYFHLGVFMSYLYSIVSRK